jgi:hypothetical protein
MSGFDIRNGALMRVALKKKKVKTPRKIELFLKRLEKRVQRMFYSPGFVFSFSRRTNELRAVM